MAKVKNSEEENLRKAQIGCLYKTLINYIWYSETSTQYASVYATVTIKWLN